VSTPEEYKIYRYAGLCAALFAASWIVPRFVTNPEGAFASGSSAILVLLGMLLAAAFVSLYLAVLTLQAWDAISARAKVAGIVPTALLTTSVLLLLSGLVY
jgi:hypothetical protein